MAVDHRIKAGENLEIIAFRLHDQEFCVRTTAIREIRGWDPPLRSRMLRQGWSA